jgi:hypothetical protein
MDYEFRVYDLQEKQYFCALTTLYPENSEQGFFSASFISTLGDECTIEAKDRLMFEQYIRMKDKEGTKIYEGDILLSSYTVDVGYMDPWISKVIDIIIVDKLDTFLYTYVYNFGFTHNIYHQDHEDKRSIFDVWKERRSKDFLVIGNINIGLVEKYKEEYQELYEKRRK